MGELSTVVLNRDLEEYSLVSGDIGTVVHDYKKDGAIEVEFASATGKTSVVVTLSKREVRPAKNNEFLRVRSTNIRTALAV